MSLKEKLHHSEKDEEYLLISKELKQWFESKPNNVILTNASILYHNIFQKMSPIGAFKYRTRNKNAIIFLEDENILRNRISHSSIGEEDYYDEEIKDILMANINDISNDFDEITENKKQIKSYERNPKAIGHLFKFEIIKDVIDIDTDLQSAESIKKIVSSYIISESLENQILEVFKNLNQPKHKAVKIIGNYGSGKSHLIAFLVSIVSNPEFANLIKNDNLLKQAKSVRKYKIIQFELLSGDVEISKWFFSETRKQLKEKYNNAFKIFRTISEEEYTDLFDEFTHILNYLEFISGVESINPQSQASSPPTGSNVFIIHGHDEVNTLRLKNLLSDQFNLNPIVMMDKPGKSQSLLEKYEQIASTCSIAFSLMTPDDEIVSCKLPYFQARPNVIFESGWFVGRLGAPRICLLLKKGTVVHSDIDGISRIHFNENIEEKMLEIQRELEAVGLLNRAKSN